MAPVLLWGLMVRSTVIDDIARREASERLLTARLAGQSVARTLDEAHRRLSLLAGQEALRLALTGQDAVALERHLADVRRDTIYETALALDPSGRLLARAPVARETYGQSFADRDYYAGALAGSGSYISEAVVSRITGQTLVVIALAVRQQERVLGLLLLTIAPTHLLDLLTPLHSTAGREISLVDQRMRVIASTDERRAPLSDLGLPGLGDDLFARSDTVDVGVSGSERIVTFAPVETARWALVVTDDAALARAAQRRFDRELAAGGSVTLALALAVAGGVAWLVTTSMRQRALLAEREQMLARTNTQLESASRHKSEFLAGMSHELRTPLNAILGFSDLLGEQLASMTSDRQKRYLRNIHDAGEHLLGLINDVLDLSKVEAGRIELRPEITTVNALVEPVVASTRGAADERGLTFSADLDGTGPVSLDTARVRQILYNLLSNAVKFTPPGGTVGMRLEADGRDLVIEVSDTGIGIPADKRDRVFGTFERLHEGRSDAPGTGLGLALTKRLVELHQGAIRFESREGEGTTFRVVLPEVVADLSLRDRILVVEDDRRDAELIVVLAGQVGLATEVVGSVASALAAIERAVPRAVVLDIRLPDGRGERILEALRADPATRGVPVIVVTVEDDEGVTQGLGADGHLTKPIDRERLSAWLHRVAAQNGGVEVPRARTAGR